MIIARLFTSPCVDTRIVATCKRRSKTVLKLLASFEVSISVCESKVAASWLRSWLKVSVNTQTEPGLKQLQTYSRASQHLLGA